MTSWKRITGSFDLIWSQPPVGQTWRCWLQQCLQLGLVPLGVAFSDSALLRASVVSGLTLSTLGHWGLVTEISLCLGLYPGSWQSWELGAWRAVPSQNLSLPPWLGSRTLRCLSWMSGRVVLGLPGFSGLSLRTLLWEDALEHERLCFTWSMWSGKSDFWLHPSLLAWLEGRGAVGVPSKHLDS